MESSGNNSRSPSIHRYNTRSKKRRIDINYKEDSDISDNDLSDDDGGEIDIYSYRQLLAELFPSKYLDNKVKATKMMMNKIGIKKIRANNVLSDQKFNNIIIAKSNNYKNTHNKYNTPLNMNNNQTRGRKDVGYNESEDEEYNKLDDEDEEYNKSDDDDEEDEDDEYDEEDEEDEEYEEDEDEEYNKSDDDDEEDEDDEYDEEDEDEDEGKTRMINMLYIQLIH